MDTNTIKKPLIIMLSLTEKPVNDEPVLFFKGGDMRKGRTKFEYIADPDGLLELLNSIGTTDDFEEVLELVEKAKAKITTGKTADEINEKLESFEDSFIKTLKSVHVLLCDGNPDKAKEMLDRVLNKVDVTTEAASEALETNEPLFAKLRSIVEADDNEQIKNEVKNVLENYELFTKSIESVNLFDQEIMSTGLVNDRVLTIDDLFKIVDNYQKLREFVKPVIKIGHSEEQPFTGDMPALGTVENLRVEDNKIKADFMNVPVVVADLIRKKAYFRVSPEIYTEFADSEGIVWGLVLRAVSLLGAEIPAFKNLQDIQGLYSKTDFSDTAGKWYIYIDKNATPCVATPLGGSDMDNEKLELAEKKATELFRENIEMKVDKYIETKKSEGKVLPAFEPALRAALVALMESPAVAKFADGDGEVEVPVVDALKKVVDGLPKLVNLGEIPKEVIEETGNEEDALVQKAESIRLDKGISFSEALNIARKK